jgi:hypothetical protein
MLAARTKIAVTHRDAADFYRIALQNSHATRQLVRIADVIAWVDSLIAESDIPDGWMLDLSLAKTPDAVIIALAHVPPPATEYLGASLFIAHVNRLWSSGKLSRDDACHLLWNVRNDLRPEHDIAAIVPEVTLEDADAAFSQGVCDPNQFARVDEALIKFFGLYDQFDLLVPDASVDPGG